MYINESIVKRILKDAGADRVSKEGIRVFQKTIEKIAFDTAIKAAKLSKHAKRKTVYGSDVKLAFQ